MPAEDVERRRVHEHLGAHFTSEGGVPGVRFAVWAPNARAVSVVGSFNRWDAREHPMRLRKRLGIWERFVPGLEPGEVYKYQIVTRQQGANLLKADPVGFFMEEPPRTASIVVAEDPFPWRDGEWMERRARHQALDRPIAIYEVHAGSWLRGRDGFLSWRELAARLIPYAADLGYTHLQLLPVTEHPFYGSWGYQTVGYFAPTSRFGTPDDFRAFVDAAHRAGLGVILDWVPAHFPKDAHGLGFFDGTHLYEHADPRQGHHPDWATYIFNFGRRAVLEFLLSSALYWLESFHVDGLRVDAVASMLYLDYSRKDGEWVPNKFGGRENLEAIAFLRHLNRVAHERFPGVLMVAEESTAWPGVSRPAHLGGLGFDLKWNMGWMHDMLEYMRLDPVFRRFHQSKLTFSLHYAYSENFLLPLSHDEVVHGKQALVTKMPGDVWRRFANLRLLYGAMYGHPGKKLLFMGGEFGQWREWHHDRSLDWHLFDDPETGPFHHGLQDWVRDLNRLYRSEPALHEVDFHWHGFQWIDFRDVDQSVISYVRRAKDAGDFLVVVVNFTPVPRPGYRIGVPAAAAYREVLNGDAREYAGSGVVHSHAIVPQPGTRHGHEQWIELTLPPLAAVFLKPIRESKT